MPRLIWSPEAIADLSRLNSFLMQNNPPAASRAIAEIRKGVRFLAERPGIGKPAVNRRPDQRQWHIPFGAAGYVVLYRFDEHEVRIVGVKHTREVGY